MELLLSLTDPLLKISIGFPIVILYVSLAHRNSIAQLTALDMVSNIMLGSIAGGPIYAKNVNILEYIAMLIFGISILKGMSILSRRVKLLRGPMLGKPIVLMQNGKFFIDNFKEKMNDMDEGDLMALLHGEGIASLRDVKFVQLERNGDLTVVKHEDKNISYVVIKKGEILEDELNRLGQDEQWLITLLKELGIEDIKTVFLGEWSDEGLFIVKNDGTVIA